MNILFRKDNNLKEKYMVSLYQKKWQISSDSRYSVYVNKNILDKNEKETCISKNIIDEKEANDYVNFLLKDINNLSKNFLQWKVETIPDKLTKEELDILNPKELFEEKIEEKSKVFNDYSSWESLLSEVNNTINHIYWKWNNVPHFYTIGEIENQIYLKKPIEDESYPRNKYHFMTYFLWELLSSWDLKKEDYNFIKERYWIKMIWKLFAPITKNRIKWDYESFDTMIDCIERNWLYLLKDFYPNYITNDFIEKYLNVIIWCNRVEISEKIAKFLKEKYIIFSNSKLLDSQVKTNFRDDLSWIVTNISFLKHFVDKDEKFTKILLTKKWLLTLFNNWILDESTIDFYFDYAHESIDLDEVKKVYENSKRKISVSTNKYLIKKIQNDTSNSVTNEKIEIDENDLTNYSESLPEKQKNDVINIYDGYDGDLLSKDEIAYLYDKRGDLFMFEPTKDSILKNNNIKIEYLWNQNEEGDKYFIREITCYYKITKNKKDEYCFYMFYKNCDDYDMEDDYIEFWLTKKDIPKNLSK